MIGAILGDMIGAPYEFDRGRKTKDFPLFSRGSVFTDDSVMTIAVAEALMDTMGQTDDQIKAALVSSMQKWGARYPHAGYGGMFFRWLHSEHPEPYGSYGNGSAMRVSAVGWFFDTLEETERVDQLTVITFGNFMVYNKKREAIHFSRTYSKEILAYLIDRCGMPVTTRDIAEDIFEDHEFGKNRSKMISKLLGYLTQDLADAGFPEVIVHQNRQIQIDRNKVHCDLYDALDGNEMVRKHYHGEYMLDYSWAETGYAASLLENMGVN